MTRAADPGARGRRDRRLRRHRLRRGGGRPAVLGAPAPATARPHRRAAAARRGARRRRRTSTGRSCSSRNSWSAAPAAARVAGGHRPGLSRADRAVRDLPGRHPVPAGRPGDRAAAGAARPRGDVPAGADLLRADAHRTPGTCARRCRWSAGTSRCSRTTRRRRARPARAPARCGTSTRWWRGGSGDEALARRAEAVAARTYELSELLVDVLGVEDVGAYYPHRVTYHPTCHSLRLLRRRRPAAAAAAPRCAGSTWSSCRTPRCAAGSAARSRSRTPTRPRPCWPTRCARCWPPAPRSCTAGDSSCLMHIGGGLSRLNAGTGHRPPGRDPREHPGLRSEHVSGHAIRAPRRRPPARRASRSPWRPARRWPTPSCGATSARPPATIRAKRAAVVAELPDWEELRAAGRGDQGSTRCAHLDAYLEQLESQVTARGGTVHWARDANRGQPRS